MDHFKETNHPLCVKLGTITSDSAGREQTLPHFCLRLCSTWCRKLISCAVFADVFSYAEDEMVEDPWLAKHLAHFGINVAQLEKVSLVHTHL